MTTAMPPSANVLTTARVQLRPWRPEDYESFALLNADEQVMQYFPATLNRQQSDAMADKINADIKERGWGFWAAEHLGSGEFMGFIGLNIPSAPLPFQPCVEIGWRLARCCWGQGLATEAAGAALGFAFEQLQLEQVVSFTALPNLRSQAVMQRLQMQRDAEDFDHPALPPGHWLSRHCLYRLTRQQWLAQAQARNPSRAA